MKGNAAKVPKVPGALGASPDPKPKARKWVHFFNSNLGFAVVEVIKNAQTPGAGIKKANLLV
jgi:hypothetical protein